MTHFKVCFYVGVVYDQSFTSLQIYLVDVQCFICYCNVSVKHRIKAMRAIEHGNGI